MCRVGFSFDCWISFYLTFSKRLSYNTVFVSLLIIIQEINATTIGKFLAKISFEITKYSNEKHQYIEIKLLICRDKTKNRLIKKSKITTTKNFNLCWVVDSLWNYIYY